MWIPSELLWCFYQLFGLSFWRHPFTAEDQLVSKWCNAKFLQINYILDGLRVSKFGDNFLFLGGGGWTISLSAGETTKA